MASKKQAAFLAMIAKSKSPAKKAFGGKAEDTKCMAKGGEIDTKATNTKNVNNSKSRQVERDRARFKGQSASTPTEKAPLKDMPTEKAPLRYGLKDMPTEKAPLRYGLKDMPTEKAPLRYGLKDKPNSASKKMAEGMERAGNMAKRASEGTKSAGVKAASSEVLGSGSALRGAGRLMGRAAGPAALLLEPSELGDSDIKGGETKWGGFDDTSSDTTRAKSRGANREAMYGTQKPAAEATVAVKKSEPKSMAAPVKKSSPREETSGSRASRQAAYDAFKADEVDYNKGLANDRMGVTADDTAELESLTDKDFKKGGMTKRPPARPTKKVPPRKFASGGTTRSSTSHRGDGCATKGHTKGRVR